LTRNGNRELTEGLQIELLYADDLVLMAYGGAAGGEDSEMLRVYGGKGT